MPDPRLDGGSGDSGAESSSDSSSANNSSSRRGDSGGRRDLRRTTDGTDSDESTSDSTDNSSRGGSSGPTQERPTTDSEAASKESKQVEGTSEEVATPDDEHTMTSGSDQGFTAGTDRFQDAATDARMERIGKGTSKEVTTPDGDREMTSGGDRGYSIGTDAFEESAVEARLERGSEADYSVEKQNDGTFAVTRETDTPTGPVSTPGDGPDMRNQSSDGLPDVEDRLAARVARGEDALDPDDVTVSRNEEGMVAPEAQQRQHRDTPGFDVELTDEGLEKLRNQMQTERDEQFGDFQIGVPGTDNTVEDYLEGASGTYQGAVRDASSELFDEGGVASESIIAEGLEAAGRDDAAAAFEGGLRRFGKGTFEGAAALGDLPALASGVKEGGELAGYLAVETAANRDLEAASDVADAGVDAALAAKAYAVENPAKFSGMAAGSLAGSYGAMSAASKVGSRTGAATRYAIQPGEELAGSVGYRATRAATSTKTAERVFPNKEPLIFSEEAAIATGKKLSGRVRDASPGSKVRSAAGRVNNRTPSVSLEKAPNKGVVDVDPEMSRQIQRTVDRAKQSYRNPSTESATGSSSTTRTVVQGARNPLGEPLPTSLGETGLSQRALNAAKRFRSESDTQVSFGARNPLGEPLPTSLGETGLSQRALNAAKRFRSESDTQVSFGARNPLGEPLPTSLGERGISERVAGGLRNLRSESSTTVQGARNPLGEPLSTSLGETGLSQRAVDATKRLRNRSSSSETTVQGPRNPLGEPLPTSLGTRGFTSRLSGMSDLTVRIEAPRTARRPRQVNAKNIESEFESEEALDDGLTDPSPFTAESEAERESRTDDEDENVVDRDVGDGIRALEVESETETKRTTESRRRYEGEYTGETSEMSWRPQSDVEVRRSIEPIIGTEDVEETRVGPVEQPLQDETAVPDIRQEPAFELGREPEFESGVESGVESRMDLELMQELEREQETETEVEVESETRRELFGYPDSDARTDGDEPGQGGVGEGYTVDFVDPLTGDVLETNPTGGV